MPRDFRSILVALSGLVIGIAIGNGAKADTFQSSTGLDQPTQLLTFDEVVLPTSTTLSNQYAAYGVTFSGVNPTYDPYAPPGNDGPNVSGHAFANFKSNHAAGELSITFSSPVSAAAFSLYSQTGITSITSYLGATQVETHDFNTNTTSTNNYYGFINSNFDRLTVSVVSLDNAFIADNLQFKVKPVPTPSALVTAFMGAVPGASLLLRRRRRK